MATLNDGAGKQHGRAIRENGGHVDGRVRVLVDRQGLAGHRRFIGLDFRRADETNVRRHAIAGLKVNDVADHERCAVQAPQDCRPATPEPSYG